MENNLISGSTGSFQMARRRGKAFFVYTLKIGKNSIFFFLYFSNEKTKRLFVFSLYFETEKPKNEPYTVSTVIREFKKLFDVFVKKW